MLDSPVNRLIIRAVFVGLLALLSSLQAALPGIDAGEGLQAVIAALVSGGGIASAEVFTPLNPNVNAGSK